MKVVLAGAALLAAPTVTARDNPDAQLQKLLARRVAGEPVSCIDAGRATSTAIIDGRAIVYRLGSKLYVNVPRSYPQSLRNDDILVTRTFSFQLCNTDTVNIGRPVLWLPRRPTFPGKFVPYTKPKQAL
ncbi:hypothetical protein [Sphingomonas sp. S2-65]|uniref:hypothetical protein n=1 Tax=Sphingomonas sp. S2-65 TaxID=2903960 RepID=UPI001F2A33A8|nr:hypothetical protein [Sphingomonas sp. S2-65]UYY59321.1 hypothetical protein LZ586_04320 [Sphingomonas sp. S2-65]